MYDLEAPPISGNFHMMGPKCNSLIFAPRLWLSISIAFGELVFAISHLKGLCETNCWSVISPWGDRLKPMIPIDTILAGDELGSTKSQLFTRSLPGSWWLCLNMCYPMVSPNGEINDVPCAFRAMFIQIQAVVQVPLPQKHQWNNQKHRSRTVHSNNINHGKYSLGFQNLTQTWTLTDVIPVLARCLNPLIGHNSAITCWFLSTISSNIGFIYIYIHVYTMNINISL